MDLFVVRGGRPLSGRVTVGGSKNATLPIMAASLMIDGPVTLSCVPDLADVTTLSHVLQSLGVSVSRTACDALAAAGLTLEVRDESNCVADYDLVRRMRASVCVLGPLLAKRGRAVVSLPGGCNIGIRPIDVHLRGLAALGADIRVERGYVMATAKRLKGAEIDLSGPRGATVTGTANVLTAAVLTAGRSVLRNVAREPEIADLARFLHAAGAQIDGVGTDVLEVEGVESLTPVKHRVIPDRIEAATLMMAAAITGGQVTLDRVPFKHLTRVLERFGDAGVCVETEESSSHGIGSAHVFTAWPPVPTDVVAQPFPGFPTDLQAQWSALMTRADGVSRIRDDVFPDRFLHVPELARLGAAISRTESGVTIQGGRPLRGANVMASDLRASAALVLAALAAEGETVIRRIYHLDRGYERLDAKLASLGADVIRRVDDAAIAVPPPL
ncbi:MAG: UDP-N-acetylglucosamine 1-carboxyvinyltransferase [Planctomycetaceae bacterium]